MNKPRLIDANALLRDLALEPMENRTYWRANEIVLDQPTAYDTDKVVEQLNNLDVGTLFCSQCKYVKECETTADEMMEKYELNDRVDLCAMVIKTKAIEIVKKGGAE